MTHDRLAFIATNDLVALTRGRGLPSADVSMTSGVGWVPADLAINSFGHLIEPNPFGALGDLRLIPDPESKCAFPVPGGDIDFYLADQTLPDGSPWECCPRTNLKRALARLAGDHGLSLMVAFEHEFALLDATEATAGPGAFTIGGLTAGEPFGSRARRNLSAAGVEWENWLPEYGPGQFEVNFNHTDDVLFAADTAVLFRKLVSGVVHQHDLEATFMAKPYADHPGNGMHVHVSLIDEAGNNVISAETGVSDNLGDAVAGVLATMRELHLVFAPHLNSFRRFQPASFAPTSPDWGIDHRGVAIRLPDTRGPAARLEHRIAGADVNPYLVLTAILGGILYGLEKKPDLPPQLGPKEISTKAPLTHDWIAAINGFAASKAAKDIFGPTFHHVFTEIKRDEAAILTRIIPPAEYRAYLSRL